MKHRFAWLPLCLITAAVWAQPAIIPQPVQITTREGSFILSEPLGIEAPDLPGLKHPLQQLCSKLGGATGVSCRLNDKSISPAIRLVHDKESGIPKEGYVLHVGRSQVLLTAADATGFFYGIQTLLQLFPPEIEQSQKVSKSLREIPCVSITDYPRFGWRGLMLDVSRHFFTVQEVKDFIDQMVRYKYNTLHWHLTDDEGWRVEIKQLPLLTSVGAWNVQKTGYFGEFKPPLRDEPRNYGGFYTQDQIRDVVAYAAERFVRVLPEIDVPGHSLAAIASYPELSCTKEAVNYRVRSGEEIMDWHDDGTFTALVDNTLCPANEKVYDFLDKVFGELATIFPFEYIHVGGDECARNFWMKSPAVQALMAREKLRDMNAVQAYFEKRVARLLEARGKKMIGWDEILEGELPGNATVMSWRGEKGGIKATQAGHDVVMSPTSYAYLDFMQADPIIEPRVYATLRLKTAYGFNPVPEGADPKHILGGQANIWTEQIYNTRHLQYMTWPRAFAIAESVWSPAERKNWPDFVSRVEQHMHRFNVQQIKFAPSMYDPIFEVKRNASGKLQVAVSTEIDSLDIRYSFDNSFPDQFYPKYTGPLTVPDDAAQLRVITYRGNTPVGRMNTLTVEEMKKRIGKGK